MEQTRPPILICIRSRDLVNTNLDMNEGTLHLFNSIECNKNELLTVSMTSCMIPNSWLNICSYLENNTLTFSETGDTSETEIIIPDGSYNIDELIEKVKELLEANSSNGLTYTLTYDVINNRVNIKNSNPTVKNTSFNFKSSLNVRRPLGFSQGEFTINSSSGVTSDRSVDVTDTYNSIYLRTNLANLKVVESSTNKYSNILAHIPIFESRNNFISYSPMEPFEMGLNVQSINKIKVAFTFQDESIKVPFQRADWEINLMVKYRKRPRAEKMHFDLHHKIDEQMKRYNDRILQNETILNEIREKNNLKM